MAIINHSTVTDIRLIPIYGVIISVGTDDYHFELLEEGSSYTWTPIYQGVGDRARLVAHRIDITAILMPNNFGDMEADINTLQESVIDDVVLWLKPDAGQVGGGEMAIGLADPDAGVKQWLFTWSQTSSQWRPKITLNLRGYFSKDAFANAEHPLFDQLSGWS